MATTHNGFQELQRRYVSEIDSEVQLYRHDKTGARLLSLINNDENKVFGITFRTPPVDSTGVAHILEHSVLCGSRKFPVKDPFIRLAQSSLNTFLNAMTFPDKTTYPVASQNVKDFYNLVDVYVDTVLHPKLTRETFEQEGWHYELNSLDSKITYRGIVFNEMKGAYSSPNAVLYKLAQEAMFPDTTYGVDSGGDPKLIPHLTYEGLKDFHSMYYHPSNAWIYFYGDDDASERLRFMNERLNEFTKREVSSCIGLQPKFAKPICVEGTYPAGQETKRAKSNMAVNWLLDEIKDPFEALALDVLDEVLIGTSASPLRRTLTDSGLGEDVIGSIDFDMRQTTAIYGLKGIDSAHVNKVEKLILDTIKTLASQGVDKKTLDAAINTVEFSLRENNTGHFPRGLSLMLRVLSSWLYDRDPFERMTFETPLKELKSRITSGELVLEKLMHRHFLKNPHRVTVIVKPDCEKAERQAAEECQRLEKVQSSLEVIDLENLVKRTSELRLLQNAPDLPEDIAKIPHLKRTDLPKYNSKIPTELQKINNIDILTHELPTNGVIYLDLAFSIQSLSTKQLTLLDVFERALLETGTTSLDFISFSQQIAQNTGGIHMSPYISTINENKEDCAAHLIVRSKAVSTKAHELVSILKNVLIDSRIDDRDRIKKIILEEKASAEAHLVPGGHIFVARRVNASLNTAGFVKEQISGLSRLFALRELAEKVISDWPSVVSELREIRNLIITQVGMKVNITADKPTLASFGSHLKLLLDAIPLRSIAAHNDWTSSFNDAAHFNKAEGFAIPASVNYVAQGGDLNHHGIDSIGAALVAQNLLSTGWLWNKVRMQGGAYGGFCRFNRRSKAFTYISYRDPNLLDTLAIYNATAQHIRETTFDKEEITRAIIGTIGNIDTHLLPDAKGLMAFQLHLAEEDEEIRQKIRDEVLATTAQDIYSFANALECLVENGRIAIMGNNAALAKANETLGENWLEIKSII